MATINPNRQKMINMMYLVLTALLALNVSKQVLRAFDLVNFSMEANNASFDSKNKNAWERLQFIYKNEPVKAKEAYSKGQKIMESSNELNEKIQKMKEELEKLGKGYREIDKISGLKSGLIKEEDIETGIRYFGADPEVPRGQGKAAFLRKELEKYKKEMTQLLPDVPVNIDTESFKEIMESDKKQKYSWDKFYFLDYPLVSNITMLTSFQNQINSTKGELLRRLLLSVNEEDRHFSNIKAILSAPKGVILEGETYKAQVFLGAYDKSSNPMITVNGVTQKVEDGMAEFSTRAVGEGNKKVKAVITVMKNGKAENYPVETEYQVYKGSATISAYKMNVVYVGLDNPISVSVPGYPPSSISATCVGGKLIKDATKGAGYYFLQPDNAAGVRESRVNVTVKDGNHSIPMGTQVYRIKSVPTPKIKYGNIEGGPKSKVEINYAQTINSVLEGFVFEGINYEVQSYKYIYYYRSTGIIKEGTIVGKQIPEELKKYVANGRQKDILSIIEIQVKGPDGIRTISQGPAISLR